MVLKTVFLADDTIKAGNDLEGILQIVATEAIPASKIEIFFEGEEYASVNTRDEKTLTRPATRGRQFCDKHAILKRDIISSRINSIIRRKRVFPQGSYETKFSLELPDDIPSSASFVHGKCVAKIEYNLRVILRGPGDKIQHQSNKVIQVQALPKPEELHPRKPRLRCHDIKSLFQRGHIFTGAQARHREIQPGQKLKIDLAVLNKSQHAVQKIKVTLRERVHWSAKRHRRTLQSNLATLQVCTNALTQGATRSTSLIDRIQDAYWHERNLDKVAAQLQTGENLLSFTLPPVPPEAHDTYVGTRLTVTHEVIIHLESKKWKRHPEVRIPVKIVSSKEDDNNNNATPLCSEPLSIVVESEHSSSRLSSASLMSGSMEGLDSNSSTLCDSTDAASWQPEEEESAAPSGGKTCHRDPNNGIFHSGIEMKPLTQTWLSFSD